MKNIKAVASDLDGTLLLSKSSIGSFTELVVNKLIREGKKFIISTGRSKNEIIELIGNLKLSDTFFITLNGAKVYDHNWNQIVSYDLLPEIVDNVLKLREKYANLIYFLHKADKNGITNKLYFDLMSKQTIEREVKTNSHNYEHVLHDIEDPSLNFYEINNFHDFEDFKDIAKIIIAGPEKSLIEYEGMILEKYGKNINAYLSTPNSLELVNEKVSKGSALKAVLEKFGISMDEAIAFGDGFNDVDMLKDVRKGILMGNANYRLKEMLPQLEVIGTNDDEAVAKYINDNVLENPIGR